MSYPNPQHPTPLLINDTELNSSLVSFYLNIALLLLEIKCLKDLESVSETRLLSYFFASVFKFKIHQCKKKGNINNIPLIMSRKVVEFIPEKEACGMLKN